MVAALRVTMDTGLHTQLEAHISIPASPRHLSQAHQLMTCLMALKAKSGVF